MIATNLFLAIASFFCMTKVWECNAWIS